MGKVKQSVEMDNLLNRLRLIEKEMPDSETPSAKVKSRGVTDPFLDAKSQFLQQLFGVKQRIKDMHEAQDKYSTKTTEQIAKQQTIRQDLKQLDGLYKTMETLLQKEAKKKKKKFSEEELKERSAFLSQFLVELKQIKQASSQGYIGGTGSFPTDIENGAGLGFDTAAFLKSAASEGAVLQSGGNGASLDLSSAQEQQLQQIKERDQAFDETLDEIDLAVTRAGELAKAINDETKVQSVMLDKVDQEVNKVQDHLDSVNVQMKQSLIDKGAGFERFCINSMCCIVLMGIITVFINLIG